MDDPEIFYSKHNRRITVGDRAIEIYIFTQDRKEWCLEVVNHEDVSWVWDEAFESDDAANAAVEETLRMEGIDVFYQAPSDDEE
jgi:hypothetical protein